MKFKMFLVGLLLSGIVQAKDAVPVVWGFGISGFGAQLSRALIDVANTQQSKETFVFEHRPGAGGSIAAKHVQATKNTVLQGSGSFFVRPNLYPNESHSVNEFQPLMTQCATPFLVLSSKHRQWSDIPATAPITIGVPGLGSTNHLIALKIAERYPNAVVVPYKGIAESMIDVLNGSIDMIVSNPEGTLTQISEGKLTALGTTGRHSIQNIATLTSQGFSSDLQDMNTMHFLAVPASMPTAQVEQLRQVFTKANKDTRVQEMYERNFCKPAVLDRKQTAKWFATENAFWTRLTSNLK